MPRRWKTAHRTSKNGEGNRAEAESYRGKPGETGRNAQQRTDGGNYQRQKKKEINKKKSSRCTLIILIKKDGR